ncbi:MAG TPA: hypothetical protein VI757_10910 [Bacteroidia bacterium]|nr:hypothetical protein [Bacteroidia bacterium]
MFRFYGSSNIVSGLAMMALAATKKPHPSADGHGSFFESGV